MTEILPDYSLKNHNSFGIDVKASRFLKLQSEEDYTVLCKPGFPWKKPFLILGGGSNLLFTSDYPGMVIFTANKGIQVEQEKDDEVILNVKAGEVWDDFVAFCVSKGYYGIENLSLIPGTAGSAPVQNIGAYGVEICEKLISVSGFDLDEKRKRELSVADCKFNYRDSIFKNELKNRFIIESVNLRLGKNPDYILSYGNVEKEFRKNPLQDLKSLRQTIINIRESKLPDHKNTGNAGSFFKNPVISEEIFLQLQERFPDIPSYPTLNGIKIPAAWLIEKAGWKGKRIGNIGTWPSQPLVIVNYGNASGKEILDFSKQIQAEVEKFSGIKLEREVQVI